MLKQNMSDENSKMKILYTVRCYYPNLHKSTENWYTDKDKVLKDIEELMMNYDGKKVVLEKEEIDSSSYKWDYIMSNNI